MKNLTLLFAFAFFIKGFAQINFNPYQNHYYNPYQVTITGNGTLYYTLDGSTPTTSSSSANGSLTITIDKNLMIKAIIKDSQNVISNVFSKNYYVGEIPMKTVYFKPPPTWSSDCAQIGIMEPNSINGYAYDNLWPGSSATALCDGWYKISFTFYEAIINVNDCHPYEPLAQTIPSFTATGNEYYDYQNGFVSTPSCLLSTIENDKNSQKITLSPNPVSEILNLKSDKNFKNYAIYDSTGNLIIQKDLNSKQINVKNLTSGMYYLKLLREDDKIIFEQFIKK